MAEPKPLTAETIAPCLSKVSRTADGRGFALINLNCSSQEVDNIDELASYQHLRNVDLKVNLISDIKPLAGLQYIIHLDVSSNQVADLDCFNEAVLPHCRTLDVSKNALTSIGTLQLPRLRSVNFRGNKIGSLEGFPGHAQLQELDLGENELGNCAGVAEMPLLTSLMLDTNKLTSIEGLAGLPQVTTLNLSSQGAEEKLEALDAAALKGIEGVVTLDVSNNGLPIGAFWNLQTLPKLRALQADGNAVEGTLKTEVLICLQRLETINGEEVQPEDREEAEALAQQRKEEEEAKAKAEAEAAEAGEAGDE